MTDTKPATVTLSEPDTPICNAAIIVSVYGDVGLKLEVGRRLERDRAALVNTLLDVLEFVEGQEDCDIDSDGYHPNEAMSLAMMIRETLEKAGVKT